ncbi:MAG TPA: hypothetical protein PLK35_01245 [Candidatus Moranbacteria bacterium]|nr:hypothetical protein [Candidatus Moranbacteria bacterium]
MDFLEKEEKLPQALKTYFRSNEPSVELKKACFSYGLDLKNIQLLSGPVGLIFVGDIKLSELPNVISKNIQLNTGVIYGVAFEINKRIFNRFPEYFRDAPVLLDQWQRMKSGPMISEEEAMRKVLELEPWLNEKNEEKKNEPKKVPQRIIEKITLWEAIKKYGEIGEQLITSSPIKLSGFLEPARPSIKNWLADYTSHLGYDNKDDMKRGNYIFQGENGRKLNFEDRQRLSYILKSFDEKTPVAIDAARKQLIFSFRNEEQKTEIPSASGASAEHKTWDMGQKPRILPSETNKEYQPEKSPAKETDNRQELWDREQKTTGKETESPRYSFPPTENTATASQRPMAFSEIKKTPTFPQKPPEKPLPAPIPEKKEVFTLDQNKNTDNLPPNLPVGGTTLSPRGNRIQFSSPQKLPYEKVVEQQTKTEPEKIPAAESQPQPYRINPVFGTNDEEDNLDEYLPKNVVNLKKQ